MIRDISVHGAVIELSDKYRLFKVNDQFMVRIPVENYLPASDTEFLRLSFKVRRVFMSGYRAGGSWEYLNDQQYLYLTNFIIELVNRQTTAPMG